MGKGGTAEGTSSSSEAERMRHMISLAGTHFPSSVSCFLFFLSKTEYTKKLRCPAVWGPTPGGAEMVGCTEGKLDRPTREQLFKKRRWEGELRAAGLESCRGWSQPLSFCGNWAICLPLLQL